METQEHVKNCTYQNITPREKDTKYINHCLSRGYSIEVSKTNHYLIIKDPASITGRVCVNGFTKSELEDMRKCYKLDKE